MSPGHAPPHPVPFIPVVLQPEVSCHVRLLKDTPVLVILSMKALESGNTLPRPLLLQPQGGVTRHLMVHLTES